MKKVNDVIDAFENKDVNLKISILEDDFVLIQGSKTSLEFMGNLLLSLASSNEDSTQFSPKGAGKHFFDRKSKLGFYIDKEN